MRAISDSVLSSLTLGIPIVPLPHPWVANGGACGRPAWRKAGYFLKVGVSFEDFRHGHHERRRHICWGAIHKPPGMIIIVVRRDENWVAIDH